MIVMRSEAMEIYTDEWAESYERLAEAGIPGRSGLYRLCQASLLTLPAEATVLVVGCGTGADLIPLAEAFPGWSFDAIEPAAPMLDRCARRVREKNLSDRISLHLATLDAFIPPRAYHGATSILVSQHLPDPALAASFFRRLHDLLLPGGRLYTADVHIARGQDRTQMLALWKEQALMSGIPADTVQSMMVRFATDISPRDEEEILGFLAAAGFATPLKPFSSVIYGAWYAQKSA